MLFSIRALNIPNECGKRFEAFEFNLQGAKKKTDPPILRFSDYIFALIASTY